LSKRSEGSTFCKKGTKSPDGAVKKTKKRQGIVKKGSA